MRNSFDERCTVLEQVARTAVRLRGLTVPEAEERARQLWERLGLTSEHTTRHAASLSGGELQRAALAQALLAEPEVLICDEIITALDAVTTELVTAELTRLRAERDTAVHRLTSDLVRGMERSGPRRASRSRSSTAKNPRMPWDSSGMGDDLVVFVPGLFGSGHVDTSGRAVRAMNHRTGPNTSTGRVARWMNLPEGLRDCAPSHFLAAPASTREGAAEHG